MNLILQLLHKFRPRIKVEKSVLKISSDLSNKESQVLWSTREYLWDRYLKFSDLALKNLTKLIIFSFTTSVSFFLMGFWDKIELYRYEVLRPYFNVIILVSAPLFFLLMVFCLFASIYTILASKILINEKEFLQEMYERERDKKKKGETDY